CIGPTCLSLTEEEFSGRLEAVAPGTVANEKRKKRSVIDDNENARITDRKRIRRCETTIKVNGKRIST
ncbi:hypothetical protein C7D74_32945, partial [Klebsiella pneumoniae]